jgi:hypothetical protein
MSRTLSSDFTEQVNRAETSTVFLTLLEIDHSSLTTPIRVVNNNENIISNGDTYYASAFMFTPPSQNDGDITPAKLDIDNVDRTIVEAVRTIDSPATITASMVLSSDLDYVEWGPIEMSLIQVTYNKEGVSGSIGFLQYLQYNVSSVVMDNSKFPGLNEWT